MRMHVLSGGRLRMRASLYFADAPKERVEEYPCLCVLLRHRGGNVLFDTGCHPDVTHAPQARWGDLAKAITPVHALGEDVLGGLRALGLGPDDIDVVVNSHLHMDHCGCNAFFRKATCHVHARDLATARDPASEGKGYFAADWDHPMRVAAIEGETDLFDDNRVVLLPLPGHTPGSIGALVELDRTGSPSPGRRRAERQGDADRRFHAAQQLGQCGVPGLARRHSPPGCGRHARDLRARCGAVAKPAQGRGRLRLTSAVNPSAGCASSSRRQQPRANACGPAP